MDVIQQQVSERFRELFTDDSEVQVQLERRYPVGPDRDQQHETPFVQRMTSYQVLIRPPDSPTEAGRIIRAAVPEMDERTLGGRLTSGTMSIEDGEWDGDDAPGRLRLRVVVSER